MNDPIEDAVNALPPFMQRRMANLSLAGARFVMEVHGVFAWRVEIGGLPAGDYLDLASAINDTWRDWLSSKNNTAVGTEVMLEHLYDIVRPLPRR